MQHKQTITEREFLTKLKELNEKGIISNIQYINKFKMYELYKKLFK